MASSVGNLTYTFVYDGLGNLVGLIGEVVTYTYDAWGNVLSTTDSSRYAAE